MRISDFGKAARRYKTAFVGLIVLLALVGCQGEDPAATETPAPGSAAPLPTAASSDVIAPNTGGVIMLEDGARLSLPPGALSAEARVAFSPGNTAPIVPIPRTLLGRAYDFALDGGELTGVALLTLPLPVDVVPPTYEVAPYRWNGKTWERINGRTTTGGIQFGASRPGVYALLGQWSLADAVVALARPESVPGQQTTPLAVAGQYHYSALPPLQDGLVQARLSLKQDTSGGAGRVTGDETLDKTVDEAQLLFKPDPAQSQGVIDFSHVFQLAPGALQLNPGDTSRFYVVLTVTDAAAPTRRLSNGVEYTQILPIQVVGRSIVRPKLAVEGEQNLRWHVRRDGQTFVFERAVTTDLPFEPILAQGGLGEYRFTLETQRDGDWVPVSNDVNVKLTVPPTGTPPGGIVVAPDGTQVAVVTPTPGGGAVTPVGTAPLVPTRRPTPGGANPAEPSATPTPAAVAAATTATATRPAWASVFWADRYDLVSGECTNLHWDVQNVISVYFNGAPTEGKQTRQVCPAQTTTYTLRVISNAGTQDRTVTLNIGTGGSQSAVEFTADATQVVKGQCTVLRWRAVNVSAVYLNNAGVAGESSQQVCPEVATTYELRVVNTDGASTTKRITITVVPVNQSVLRFWADQYTLPTNACTVLSWNVQNVQEVFLEERPVMGQGSESVCPQPGRAYTLRVTDSTGSSIERSIVFFVGDPVLTSPEVIARGIVNEVTDLIDSDASQAGDQPAYRLVIDGISPLYTGMVDWGQSAVTLMAPKSGISADPNAGAPVDWPISPGQQVEFRAFCEGATCDIRTNQGSYLRWRSP
jgi:hypothetical protein